MSSPPFKDNVLLYPLVSSVCQGDEDGDHGSNGLTRESHESRILSHKDKIIQEKDFLCNRAKEEGKTRSAYCSPIPTLNEGEKYIAWAGLVQF